MKTSVDLPEGIEFESSGDIYIADRFNDRIQKMNSTGSFLSKYGTSGTGEGEFNQPRGIAFDSSGNIYVVDSNNHRIQKFDSSGNFVSMFGFGVDDGSAVF